MMFTRKFERPGQPPLEIDGSYRTVDNSIEVTEYTAWLWRDRHNPQAPEVELTPDEDQRLHEELTADPDTWEYEQDF